MSETLDATEYAAFHAALRCCREPELTALLTGLVHAMYPTATHVRLESDAGAGPGGRLFLSGIEDATGLIASEATDEPDNDDRYMPLCTAVQPVLEVLADYVSAGRISLTPPTGPALDVVSDSLAREADRRHRKLVPAQKGYQEARLAQVAAIIRAKHETAVAIAVDQPNHDVEGAHMHLQAILDASGDTLASWDTPRDPAGFADLTDEVDRHLDAMADTGYEPGSDGRINLPPPGEPPAQRLLALAQRLAADPADLDNAVHDAASTTASQVNNGGFPEQIAYLLDRLGEAGTEQVIRAAGHKPDPA